MLNRIDIKIKLNQRYCSTLKSLERDLFFFLNHWNFNGTRVKMKLAAFSINITFANIFRLFTAL